MKSWIHSFLIILMLTGPCYAQASSNFSSLPADWQSKVWVYNFIDQQKIVLEQKKRYYTDTVGIKKIYLFKLFQGGSQHILAFGPFETKDDAFQFFKTNQSDIFNDQYNDERVPSAQWLKNWFDIDEHGEPIFSSTETRQLTSLDDEGDREVIDLSLQERKNVQKLLQTLNLYKGIIDGEFGPGTKRAIKKWQQSLGQRETSYLTVAEYRELLKEPPENVLPSPLKPIVDGGSNSLDLENPVPSDTPKIQKDSNSSTSESDAPSWSEAEVKDLIEEHEKRRASLLATLTETRNSLQLKLDTALLNLFQKPIKEMIDWKGKLPDGSIKDISIEFEENCLKFSPNQSLEEIIKELGNKTNCLKISGETEINTEKNPTIETDVLKSQIILSLRPSFPVGISSIVSKPSIANLDIYACAFNLLFSDKESGATFEMQMLFETDGSAKSNGTIDENLSEKEIDLKYNNWKNLTVQVKKSPNKDTNCEPQETAPELIVKEGATGRFTISRDGILKVKDVKLRATLDDLVVFISKNIGIADDGSGGDNFDPNYPFSSDLELQTFYFERALEALQRYTEKTDSNYGSVQIYGAKESNFVKKLSIALPNTNIELSHQSIFNDPTITLKHVMPDIGLSLRTHEVAKSTGILVIASFGLSSRALCDHSMYDKIIRNRPDAAITILNFVPYENISSSNYKTVHRAPATLQCPNKASVLLVYPNDSGRMASEKVTNGFFDIINERFRK